MLNAVHSQVLSHLKEKLRWENFFFFFFTKVQMETRGKDIALCKTSQKIKILPYVNIAFVGQNLPLL